MFGEILAKLNCWEFKKCGRERGGAKVDELGVCPASTERSVNGIHDGENGGRCCWAVAGTLCGGKVQGMYAFKYHSCEKCDFYKLVTEEEGADKLRPKQIIQAIHTAKGDKFYIGLNN